jgi:hypothetical protein
VARVARFAGSVRSDVPALRGRATRLCSAKSTGRARRATTSHARNLEPQRRGRSQRGNVGFANGHRVEGRHCGWDALASARDRAAVGLRFFRYWLGWSTVERARQQREKGCQRYCLSCSGGRTCTVIARECWGASILRRRRKPASPPTRRCWPRPEWASAGLTPARWASGSGRFGVGLARIDGRLPWMRLPHRTRSAGSVCLHPHLMSGYRRRVGRRHGGCGPATDASRCSKLRARYQSTV